MKGWSVSTQRQESEGPSLVRTPLAGGMEGKRTWPSPPSVLKNCEAGFAP